MHYTEDGLPRDSNANRRRKYRRRGSTQETRGRKISHHAPPMSDEHVAWCDVMAWHCQESVSRERYQEVIQKFDTHIEAIEYIKTLCPICHEEFDNCKCPKIKEEISFHEKVNNYEKFMENISDPPRFRDRRK